MLEGLYGEDSTEICRKERIAENLYYKWSKGFLEGGKKILARNTTREATSHEVKTPQAEIQQALLMIFALGLVAYVLEAFAEGRSTTRPRRIVRDRRPILLRDVIAVPAQKRAGRVVRDRPPPIRLDMPPPRPRSRLVERRTGPFVEDLE